MENPQLDVPQTDDALNQEEPKWDYTTSGQTLFIGALVVGLNVVVLIAYLLYRYVPAAHSFFTGKPL
tara:strand:- start:716 stop:916 length:201 start_codon:yes stop_codon:yes gene_type:complete